ALSIGLAIIRFLFGIPLEGSVAIVYAGAAVYLPAALGLGLLISTALEARQQALFVTFFVVVTFFFLRGRLTHVQAVPGSGQTVAEGNPIRHFVQILRTVLIKGGTLSDVAGALGAMGLFAAVVLSLAVVRYRKTVE